jgi:hypothetical protein
MTIHSSYSAARATAAGRSLAASTLLTPTDDPRFAGFTKSG